MPFEWAPVRTLQCVLAPAPALQRLAKLLPAVEPKVPKTDAERRVTEPVDGTAEVVVVNVADEQELQPAALGRQRRQETYTTPRGITPCQPIG